MMSTFDAPKDLQQNLWWDLALQLRRSRAQLGSVLDWLETSGQNLESIESIYECAEDVRAEIDRLIVAIAVLPSSKNPS